VDNRPLLAAGKPETRQYKAVFFTGKSEIGLTSAVVVTSPWCISGLDAQPAKTNAAAMIIG
jgi:hypothetical protein